MKILFKHSKRINDSKSLNLDFDLSVLVGEVRKRISRILDIPLCSFHLVAKKSAVKVLMTDSWPLSFFLDEDDLKVKINQLDLPFFMRKESMANFSTTSSGTTGIRYSYSFNSLYLAIISCKCGDLASLKAIIEADGNSEDLLIHQVQECQWGLLHYACASGHSDIVSFLVSQGVNCNKVTIDEWTPLQLCCFFQNVACVKALLVHQNLQVNKRTRFRGTALHLACAQGNIEIVKALLKKNPVMSIEDHRLKTPIEYVEVPEIFEILAIYSGECELKRCCEETLVPFCSEVFLLDSCCLNDKMFFLYLDPETGCINRYPSKVAFLDKKSPRHSIKLVDIQVVNIDLKRNNHYFFSIETHKSTLKYYTKFEALTLEWVQRIHKASEYCLIHNQNILIDQIIDIVQSPVEDESTLDSANLGGENELIDFSSFTIMDEIGSGSFGIVYKVRKNSSEQLFAMKSLSKAVLQKQKQLKYAISECKIMRQLNHPFIVPLHYAFQTPKYLYLILELCANGDLFGLLEKKGKLSEQIAKFYLAEVILALEYLHDSGIIYRDLKPANVLIDNEFHAKLADFGLAKEKFDKVNPAMTMAGTPAYLPPEIVVKKGASFSSDIYGLGPLLYELLTGQTPYYADDLCLLFQNIKTAKLSFPDYISHQAKDLITCVMNKDPAKRPQISQIKRHQFFRKLDWEALLGKKIRPPRLD